MRSDTHLPEFVPILSRGKHRNPRKGACFMELASYFAGERWSDHPSCTHPLLATLARLVNDYTSDARRGELAPLIPSVIGLTGEDLHIDARIALRSATTALPIVAAEQQRILAVSILGTERVLADLDGRPGTSLEPRSNEVLAEVPHAAQWARRFTRGIPTSPKGFRRHAAPTIVRTAVWGIARACIQDPDAVLRQLLVDAIDECAALTRREQSTTVDATTWQEACELMQSPSTGSASSIKRRLSLQPFAT